MPVTQRVAPEGAHLSNLTRLSDRLTPEEIAAARVGRQEVGSPPPPPREAGMVEPEAVPVRPNVAPVAPPVTAPDALPPGPPAVLGAHAIAQLCNEAGVPELTLSMLQQPMTLKQVEARLESARLVMQCGNLLGLPTMGRQLMLAGVSIEAARKMMNEVQVQADGAIVIDPTISNGPPSSMGRINSAAVYSRLNARMAKGDKAG